MRIIASELTKMWDSKRYPCCCCLLTAPKDLSSLYSCCCRNCVCMVEQHVWWSCNLKIRGRKRSVSHIWEVENWGVKIPWLSHFTWWICGSSGIWFQISQVVRYYKKRKTRRCENRNVHILLTFSVCTLALSTYSVICSEEKSGWRWFVCLSWFHS